MIVIIRPDEPMKLISLVGSIMEIDVSKVKTKLANLTISGPGITLDEKITDKDGSIEHFTCQIQIQDAAAPAK